MVKTAQSYNGISKDPNAPINWKVELCNICMQMTNHNGDGDCLKCRSREKDKLFALHAVRETGGKDET